MLACTNKKPLFRVALRVGGRGKEDSEPPALRRARCSTEELIRRFRYPVSDALLTFKTEQPHIIL